MAAPRQKTIYVLYIVGFLDLLGVSMIIPLLSLQARDLGASPALTGILGSTYGFLQLFSSPMVGDWSDRSGRRLVLVYSLLLSAVGYFMLASATTLYMLFLSRIPTGLFKHSQEVAVSFLGTALPKSQHAAVLGRFHAVSSVGFIVGPVLGGHLAELQGGFHLVAMATTLIFVINAGLFKQTQSLLKVALAAHIPEGEKPAAFGRFNSISTLGFVVGPVLGGHMAELMNGRALVISISASICVLNAVIVWWFLPADVPDSSAVDEKTSGLAAGLQFRQFIKNLKGIDWDVLWDLFAVRFLLGFASIVYRSNFSLSLDSQFHVSSKQIGYIISYVSIISTVSGFFVGHISRWYSNDKRLLLHVGILQALSIGLSTCAPSVAYLIVAMAPLSVANAVARVCITNLLLQRVRGGETGAVLGCGASVSSVARMMSPMIGGFAWQVHPSGPGLIGVISALSSVVLVGTVRSFNNLKHEKTS